MLLSAGKSTLADQTQGLCQKLNRKLNGQWGQNKEVLFDAQT